MTAASPVIPTAALPLGPDPIRPAPSDTQAAGHGDGSAMGFQAWRDTRFFACLDGLRALSILAVVWHHSGGGELNSIGWSRGFLGVDVFFAISGFLIVTLLLRERDRHGRISLRGFYARRSLRIFPVYYGFLLGITAVYLIFKPGDPDTAAIVESLPATLLYVSNVIIPTIGLLHLTWSLSTEEQFYLAWAPAEKLLPRLVVFGLLGLVIVASLGVNFGLFDNWLAAFYGRRPDGSAQIPSLFGTTLLPMALGVVLAHAMHRPQGFDLVRRIAGFPGAAWVWAVALLVLIFALPGDIRGWVRPTMQFLMVGLLAAVLLRDSSTLGRALRWRPLARVGLVSYGIYLFHKPVTVVVEAVFGKMDVGTRGHGLLGAFILTTAVLLLTWVVAEVSFRCYEMPFLRLKKSFERTRAGAADVR